MPPLALPAHDTAGPSYSGEGATRLRTSLSPARIASWAGYGLFAMVAAFICAGTMVPALLGLHSTTVYGGSMGSSLPAGSVAVTETIDAADVRVGDVVAFSHSEDGGAVMHRVVAIDERDGQRIATLRGDNNATHDSAPLLLTNGQGDRLVYHVPLLGYVLHYARTTAVLILAAAGLAVFLAWDQFGTRQKRRG